MSVFFDNKDTNRNIELISYIVYFIFITLIYLTINIPILMMISNILAFVLLTLNYKTTIKNRLVITSIIYIILLCIESLVSVIMRYIYFPSLSLNNFSSILGIIFMRIISYIVVLIINNCNNIKNREIIPASYWLAILIIPTSSMYVFITIFQSIRLTSIQVLICVILLISLNFVSFYIYDVLKVYLNKQIMLERQIKYYLKQFELIKSSLDAYNTFQHDLNNHLSTILSIAKNKDVNSIERYILKMNQVCINQKEYSKSGNIDVDSILNFKLFEAENRGVKINIEVNLPEIINVTFFDFSTILCNLIDNAITATCKLKKEERKIDIAIRFDKNRLILKVQNTFNGKIICDKNKIVTMHANKNKHGIGLKSVQKTADKYNGFIDIEYNGNIFKAIIILHLQNEEN